MKMRENLVVNASSVEPTKHLSESPIT